MNREKISKNFYLDEFLPPELYDMGVQSTRYIDFRVVEICQLVRNFTDKPLLVNNWLTEGEYRYSGFRPPSCTIGANNSAHRYGLAADIKIYGMDAPEVQEMLERYWEEKFKPLGMTRLEINTPTWTHFDLKPTSQDGLFKFKP